LRIVPGGKRDYEAFAAMHYRATDELGFVDKIFVLQERASGTLGIVVYAHAPLELSLRNQATNGWFSRNPHRVNQSLRILRRLVIHPDLRGCGLGHHLVRRTLPRVGVEFIECLATMGEFNPVFEKAGMRRVGQYPVSKERNEALLALHRLGVDPNAREFVIQVCRSPQVRAIVYGVVARWYASTTGAGERRALRQPPELLAQTFRGLVGARPVYYLWRRANSRFPKGGGERMANGESRMANGTARSSEVDRHAPARAGPSLGSDAPARAKSRTNPFSPSKGKTDSPGPGRTQVVRKDCRPDRNVTVDYGPTD
jgi:GNAT superfamily N-acetyltransferase